VAQNKFILFTLLVISALRLLADGRSDSLIASLPIQEAEDLPHIYNQISEILLDEDAEASLKYAKKSLELSRQANNSREEGNALHNIALSFSNLGYSDTAILYLDSSIIISKSYNYDTLRLNNILKKGYAFLDMSLLDSAESCFLYLQDQAQRHEIKAFLPRAYSGLAIILNRKGLEDSSVTYYTKSVEGFLAINDEYNAGMIMNNIATVMFNFEKYDLAKPYIDSSIRMNKRNKNIPGLFRNYVNLSVIYRHDQQYDSALLYIQQGLKIAKQTGQKLSQANVYYSAASVLFDMGDLSRAKKYSDSSRLICNEINSVMGIFSNNLLLSEMYEQEGNYSEANKILRRNLNIARKHKIIKAENTVLERLYLNFRKRGIYDSALFYNEEYNKRMDAQKEENVLEKIEKWKGKYNDQLAKEKIVQLEKEKYKRLSELRIIVILFILIIASLVIIIIYRFQKSRNARLQIKLKNSEAEKLAAEREKLSLELEYRQKELAVSSINIDRFYNINKNTINMMSGLLPALKADNRRSLEAIIKKFEKDSRSYYSDEFELRFKEVQSEFYHTLLKEHPDLSPSEIKLCGYLRLNLTTKDIADLTSRNNRTIENSRSRIRAKLGLSKDQNLVEYLLKL